MKIEQIQKTHFNKIASRYDAHHREKYSQKFRNRCIHDPLFEGIELQGKKVLEGLCGSGLSTQYLLSRGADVTGLDLSYEELKLFKKHWPETHAICSSIFNSGLRNDYYDCIVVIGGLHHLQPKPSEAVFEIHKKLKKGGSFCFMEPHNGFKLYNFARNLMQKYNPLFGDNEVPIDLASLKNEFRPYFSFKKEMYQGNFAYFFVFNSRFFKIPLRLKPVYSPFLIGLERIINRIQGKRSSCYVLCQWQKM